ncbi:MAG: hypothetical protein IPJ79_01215 [Bacteroidetes bacterium]|nr:hypothetical protein [Bacteroidota bacterium]
MAEFFIPVFLFAKRDDYALFGEGGYMPDVNETTLVLLARNADEYSIKAFDFEGVRIDLFNWYREFLNQKTEDTPNKKNFIESIKPFLVFYRQLNEYSKKTKQLSSEALAIRDAIANSVDPEKTFFEDFPKALRTSVKEIDKSKTGLKDYAAKLKRCITEIRTSYEELLNRYEKFICKEIVGGTMPFDEYKEQLQSRFENIKEYMMLNHQSVFHQRICSPLDDRKSWLSSVAQSLLNKSLESIADTDVKILFEKFKTVVHELDNLVEISTTKSDTTKEKVFKFEVTGEKLSQKTIVKIPKTKFAELDETERQIKKILKKDKQINIAVLTKLIQEQLKNE